MYLTALVFALFVSPLVSAAPVALLDANTLLLNGQDAQALNTEFQNLKTTDPCTSGQTACIAGALAQCVSSAWNTTKCPASLSCFALPSVRDRGTIVFCTSQASALSLIHAAGTTGGVNSTNVNTTVPFPISNTTSNSTSSSQCGTPPPADLPPTPPSNSSVSSSTSSSNVSTVTLSSETRTLDSAQVSSLLASLASSGSFSAISTLPASDAQPTASSSSSTPSPAATTVFLNSPPSSTSPSMSATSTTSSATASGSSAPGYGY